LVGGIFVDWIDRSDCNRDFNEVFAQRDLDGSEFSDDHGNIAVYNSPVWRTAIQETHRAV